MPGHRGATRRAVLRASGAAIVPFSAAGCLGGEGEDGERKGSPDDTTPDPAEIERGGNFTIGYPSKLETLNALTATSAYSWGLLELVHQAGVVVEPETFEVMPWAFSEWDHEETDGGMNVYFSINDELEWNDGEEFTVDDAIFTYEYYMEQEPGRYLSAISPMEAVSEADNGYDVELQLNEVVGTWELDQLSLYLLPEHVWEDVDDHTRFDPEGDPVGLGPGRVTRIDPDTAAEVELNQEWPLTRQGWVEDHDLLLSDGPFLDTVRYQIFGSDSALQQAFLNGDVDAIYDDAFDENQSESVEDREGLGLIEGHDDGYRHFTVNMRNEPFDDQSFRQAMHMAMDEIQWVNEMSLGFAIPGSVPIPPVYEHLRPETAAGKEVQQSPEEEAHPALEALWFREEADGNGVFDVEAVRSFLENGEVISGEEGEYAGQEYPGSLTGFGTTFQTESAYDYEFGELRSNVLEDAAVDVDRELYVDGRTIEEINGGPITMLNYPPDQNPRVVDFTQDYIGNLRQLGIPIEQEIVTFSSMSERVYLETDFDIYPMSWSNFSTQGADSLYAFFHSDNAHGPDSDFDSFAYNAAGYGLEGLPGADGVIDEMRTEVDDETRNALVQKVAERIYLEAPTFVIGYALPQWPVNEAEYGGYMSDVPGVGSSNLWLQCLNVHQR